MIRRPPRSTPLYSSAASDVYKRQLLFFSGLGHLAEGGYLNLPILGNLFFHAALATLALFFPCLLYTSDAADE